MLRRIELEFEPDWRLCTFGRAEKPRQTPPGTWGREGGGAGSQSGHFGHSIGAQLANSHRAVAHETAKLAHSRAIRAPDAKTAWSASPVQHRHRHLQPDTAECDSIHVPDFFADFRRRLGCRCACVQVEMLSFAEEADLRARHAGVSKDGMQPATWIHGCGDDDTHLASGLSLRMMRRARGLLGQLHGSRPQLRRLARSGEAGCVRRHGHSPQKRLPCCLRPLRDGEERHQHGCEAILDFGVSLSLYSVHDLSRHKLAERNAEWEISGGSSAKAQKKR